MTGLSSLPRMGGSAKVSPSPLASDKTRKELPAEPLDEELVGSEQPLKGQGEQTPVSWDDLPGSVLELVFNHLKRAAMAGEKVFLKSPDQQVIPSSLSSSVIYCIPIQQEADRKTDSLIHHWPREAASTCCGWPKKAC